MTDPAFDAIRASDPTIADILAREVERQKIGRAHV